MKTIQDQHKKVALGLGALCVLSLLAIGARLLPADTAEYGETQESRLSAQEAAAQWSPEQVAAFRIANNRARSGADELPDETSLSVKKTK